MVGVFLMVAIDNMQREECTVTGLHRKVTFPAILALLIVTMLSPVGPSQGNEYTVTPVIRLSYERLMAAQSVQRALRFLEQADIESDPDGGAISRQSLLARAGLEYVQTDQAGNMFGVLRGARTGDTVAVATGVRSFRALVGGASVQGVRRAHCCGCGVLLRSTGWATVGSSA